MLELRDFPVFTIYFSVSCFCWSQKPTQRVKTEEKQWRISKKDEWELIEIPSHSGKQSKTEKPLGAASQDNQVQLRSAELGLTLGSWTDVAVRSEDLGAHISLYKMSTWITVQPGTWELHFIQWELLGLQAWKQHLNWPRGNYSEEAGAGGGVRSQVIY